MKPEISFYITDITRSAGTERVISNLSNELSSFYKIKIYSLNSKEGKAFYYLNSDIDIIHLGLKSYIHTNGIKKYIAWIKNLILFYNYKKKDNSNVVIGTSRNTNIFLLIYKNKGQKVIGCEHFAFNCPMNGFLRKIRDYAYKYLYRLVVLTKIDEKYYMNKNIKTIVIPNFNTFDSLPLKTVYNKEKKVLAIGRHTKLKAFHKLLEIWKESSSFNDGWNLYIIGEGELFEENIKLKETLNLLNVHFISPTNEVLEYYKSCSIYLMTSIYEAFPMVLLEAKTCGLVSVSYDCPTGPREIIEDNKDGYLIEMDDKKSYIEKLKLLMTNDMLRYKLSENALANSQKYSAKNIMPYWFKLLNDIIIKNNEDSN